MKIENSIGWCDATTNMITGCARVAPECKNCYAAEGTPARVLRDRGIETWGPGAERVLVRSCGPTFRRLNKLCVCDKCHTAYPIERMTSEFRYCKSLYNAPLGPLCCEGTLRRIRIFADSNSDWLDKAWPESALIDFLDMIRLAPNVDVLLLTKRAELFKDRMLIAMAEAELQKRRELHEWISEWADFDRPPGNVWIGASLKNRSVPTEAMSIPARVRFISAEPLLPGSGLLGLASGPGRLGLKDHFQWVIVGGESGPERRDCGQGIIEGVAAECVAAGVPCYVKQDCAARSGQRGRLSDDAWALKQFPKV